MDVGSPGQDHSEWTARKERTSGTQQPVLDLKIGRRLGYVETVPHAPSMSEPGVGGPALMLSEVPIRVDPSSLDSGPRIAGCDSCMPRKRCLFA